MLGCEEEDTHEGAQFVLPFVCERDARTVHNVAAFNDLNIYRDRYERQILPPRGSLCAVVRLEDHPELREFHRQARDMFDEDA